jgi:hypothetical protein
MTGICEAGDDGEWQETGAKLPQYASRSSAARREPEKLGITTDVLNASLTVWNQPHPRLAEEFQRPIRRPRIIIAPVAACR